MNPNPLLIASLILLFASGLATWGWLAMAQVEREFRSFSGFEGMHFEIGPQATETAERAGCPIPG
jgi:hypothetical protein